MANSGVRKAVFLAANGFCEREYIQAHDALEEMGFDCRLVSVDYGLIKGWNELENKNASNWGYGYAPDKMLDVALSSDYEVLVMPGGIRNVEKIKLNSALKPFISSFIQTGKPVVAYNRAIEILSMTGLSGGYKLASSVFSSEMLNAKQEDAVVVSGNLITISGYPDAKEQIQSNVSAIIEKQGRGSSKAA